MASEKRCLRDGGKIGKGHECARLSETSGGGVSSSASSDQGRRTRAVRHYGTTVWHRLKRLRRTAATKIVGVLRLDSIEKTHRLHCRLRSAYLMLMRARQKESKIRSRRTSSNLCWIKDGPTTIRRTELGPTAVLTPALGSDRRWVLRRNCIRCRMRLRWVRHGRIRVSNR